MRRFAARTRQPLRLIECVCPEATVERRLCADAARAHPAANRDVTLYRRLQATAEPILDPKRRLDTTQPLGECADRALSYLNHPLPTDPNPVHTAVRPPSNETTA
ncbi:MAG: hypothetical protein ACRDRI_11515 [Pseudonocardiaceae bacterium]